MPSRMSPQERDRFLQGRHIAVLITTDSEGRPVPTPIWYLYRDGLLYFRTDEASAKIANVRRDARVSVCVQEERAPYKAVIVHGTASVQDDPDWLAEDTPQHYLGFVGAIGYKQAAQSAIEMGPAVAIVRQAGAFRDLGLHRRDALVRASMAPRKAATAALALTRHPAEAMLPEGQL